MRQIRLLVLEYTEQEDTCAPEPRRPSGTITTTGETVDMPRPLAKCGEVVAIETWRKRRAVR